MVEGSSWAKNKKIIPQRGPQISHWSLNRKENKQKQKNNSLMDAKNDVDGSTKTKKKDKNIWWINRSINLHWFIPQLKKKIRKLRKFKNEKWVDASTVILRKIDGSSGSKLCAHESNDGWKSESQKTVAERTKIWEFDGSTRHRQINSSINQTQSFSLWKILQKKTESKRPKNLMDQLTIAFFSAIFGQVDGSPEKVGLDELLFQSGVRKWSSREYLARARTVQNFFAHNNRRCTSRGGSRT